MIKIVHNDVHCGIRDTQKRLKLVAWLLGYQRSVENHVHKCAEIKVFHQNKVYTQPRETERGPRFHMDHAHVNSVGLGFIMVDSFSSWPEVSYVHDKKTSTIR